MANTFFGMTIASSGLAASNISINTTVFEYLNQLYGISFEELYNIDKEITLENLTSIFNTIRGKTTQDCFIGVDDDKVFLSVFSFSIFDINLSLSAMQQRSLATNSASSKYFTFAFNSAICLICAFI